MTPMNVLALNAGSSSLKVALFAMGAGDVTQTERERDDLVMVLRTGSLPAPLREVGP